MRVELLNVKIVRGDWMATVHSSNHSNSITNKKTVGKRYLPAVSVQMFCYENSHFTSDRYADVDVTGIQ